jgi:hypothetical protein
MATRKSEAELLSHSTMNMVMYMAECEMALCQNLQFWRAAGVAGKLHVRLHESNTECNFDVLVRGEVLSHLAARSRPVTVLADGNAPFSVCQSIAHQDDQFMAQSLTMDVRNHFTLDEICSNLGALTRLICGLVKSRFDQARVTRFQWLDMVARLVKDFSCLKNSSARAAVGIDCLVLWQ